MTQKTGDRNNFYGRRHNTETINKISDGLIEYYSNNSGPMTGKSVYETWVDKYGITEADRKMIIYSNRLSESRMGEKNPMYGKPSPGGSGNGWKGWYKGFFFRSLLELSFIYQNKDTDIRSAEFMKIEYISYIGSKRTYSPDYIIGNILYEIKPMKLFKSKSVSLKAKAASIWCENNNYIYELVEPIKIDFETIKNLFNCGEIVFTDKYKIKFLNYVEKHKSN